MTKTLKLLVLDSLVPQNVQYEFETNTCCKTFIVRILCTVKSNYRGSSTLIYGGYKRNNKVYLQEK